MRLRHLSAFLVLSMTAIAHADTLSTFNFNAVLDPNTGTGGTVSGQIVIDTTAGTFYSSSLSSVYGSSTYAVSSNEKTSSTTNGSLVVLTFGSIGSSSSAFLSLVLPTTTLVNYGGGAVCNDTTRCSEPNNSNYSSSYFAPSAQSGDGLTSGSLTLQSTMPTPTPGTTTPEPSGLVLVGSGILGLVGRAVRRRRIA